MLTFTSSVKPQNSFPPWFLYAHLLHKEKTTWLSCTCMACVTQNRKTIQNKMSFSFCRSSLKKSSKHWTFSVLGVPTQQNVSILLRKNTKNCDAIVNPMHPKFQHFVHMHPHLSALVKQSLKLVVYLQVALFRAIPPAQKTRQFAKMKCPLGIMEEGENNYFLPKCLRHVTPSK